MVRLIGILSGSAIAVSILIVALGIPEFAPPDEERINPEQPVAQAPPVKPTPLPESAPLPAPEPAPEPELVSRPEPAPESVPEPELAPEPEPVPVAAASVEQGWYAFWSPFRSKIAADGFVAELQKTTGLDYRVVKLKPGVYEVAFAYSDDADIAQKLSQITAATGLAMSGG